ncbi:MAG: hypothetical protein DDT34_00767 [Firmicutes bacterium]|nr:hypothetical protein [Bacillota bacterium]
MPSWVRRFLPSAFTLGNLYLGILAIVLVISGEHWRYASFVIIVGMFFDGLDGRLARMLDVSSSFGKELDSLADVITFGVAPAVLLIYLRPESALYHVAAVVFAFCGAIRLARFNTQLSLLKGHFTGLPIPAAGGLAATATLYFYQVPWGLLPAVYFGLAALMVSRVPYPDFKGVRLPQSQVVLALTIVGTVIVLWFARSFVFVPLVLYALFGLGWHRALWRRLPVAWKIRYEKQKAARLKRRLEKRARRVK